MSNRFLSMTRAAGMVLVAGLAVMLAGCGGSVFLLEQVLVQGVSLPPETTNIQVAMEMRNGRGATVSLSGGPLDKPAVLPRNEYFLTVTLFDGKEGVALAPEGTLTLSVERQGERKHVQLALESFLGSPMKGYLSFVAWDDRVEVTAIEYTMWKERSYNSGIARRVTRVRAKTALPYIAD